jgi:putative tricarboxylic transport membrane protein
MAAGGMFSVVVMVIFATLGYIMNRYEFSIVIFIISFFLGPRFEISIAQSTSLMSGDWTKIIEYPIAVALLALSILMLFLILRRSNPTTPAKG